MGYKFTKLCAGVLSVMLCAIAVLCSGIIATAEDAPRSLEYGIEDRENNTKYTAEELYELLFGSAPTAAEAEYLNATGITFSYNSLVPQSLISTDYQSETGLLSISIQPYVYTAKNGETVTWIPTHVTVGGTEVAVHERDGVYYGSVEGLFYSEDFEMVVDYGWSVEIPEDVIRELRTSAYEKGAAALLLRSAYESELAEYNTALAEYNAWMEYVEKKALYDAYLAQLEQFRIAKEAYENYLAAYEQYLVDLEVYEQWVAYDEAVAYFNTQFYDQYLAHQNYLQRLEEAKGKLAVLNSLFVQDSNNWQMYASIMGGTVDSVLKHKDELVGYLKCDEEDVDLAGSATEELRKLLKAYNQIRTAKYSSDHEKFAARYEYYLNNYDALKLHFKDLYRSLNALFQNEYVERTLQSEGKREHYLQFVGQLYIISTCLDETGSRNENWTISGKKLSEVVEDVHMIPDGDWDPRNTEFPEEVEPAGGAERPKPPTASRPSKLPEPPDEVPHYGTRPQTVQDPDKNGIPVKREEHPGDGPSAPTFDALTARLLEEVEAGTLKRYEGTVEAVTLDYVSTVKRMVSILNYKTVNFYDYDGTLLYSAAVPYGDSLFYHPPVRENTAAYTYRYLGWRTMTGGTVDLSSIKSDLDLYAAYEATKCYYTVTWHLDGIDHDGDGNDDEYSELWGYGEIPSPGAGVPIQPYETAYHRYHFSGWDREIAPVTGDVVYRGTMERSPKTFTVTWVVCNGAQITQTEWEYGMIPSYDGNVEMEADSYIYTFSGWDRLVGSVTGDVTYTAVYEKKPIATDSVGGAAEVQHGVDEMTVSLGGNASANIRDALKLAAERGVALKLTWDSGYAVTVAKETLERFALRGCMYVALQTEVSDGKSMLTLGFYDDRWHALTDAALEYTLHLPYVNEEVRKTEFLLTNESGTERIAAKTVSVYGALQIQPTYSYDMIAPMNEFCYSTMQLNKKALVGERVSLRLPCIPGYTVTGATVLCADGTEVPVEDLEFVMPASTVTIELKVEKIVYTVTFMVDGEIWNQETYFHGDKILLPAIPHKPDGEDCAYTFIGWGDVPALAVGDEYELVFHANFRETVKNVDYDTGHNNNILAEVIIPCFLIGLAVVTGGVVTLIVLRKRAKKRRVAEAAVDAVEEKEEA